MDALLEGGFNFTSFDFSGSGMSEGEYVSLGYYESQDIQVIIDYIKSEPWYNGNIYLWGRSMGGASTLMAASREPTIKGINIYSYLLGIIVDSSFSNMKQLAIELG